MPSEVLLELVKLSDLSRASYVGPVFARLFYETGADTPEKLATSQPQELAAHVLGADADEANVQAGPA